MCLKDISATSNKRNKGIRKGMESSNSVQLVTEEIKDKILTNTIKIYVHGKSTRKFLI